MFENNNVNEKINLGDSYIKNYEFLFKNVSTKEESDIGTFNDLPIFKYKKLILKYDKLPTEIQIREDIQEFINKVNVDDNFKVFNIKANRNTQNSKDEYVIIVALINANIK